MEDVPVKLTPLQIKDLQSIIPLSASIPRNSALAFQYKTRSALERELKGIRLRPSKYEKFKKIIQTRYVKSLVEPGEAVGILCAQSIGQMNTQMTLNSFHHAGISEAAMTAGVPKFQELLSATANPKIVNASVYFIHRPRTLAEVINLSAGKFKGLTLKDVILKWKVMDNLIYFDLDWKTMYRYGIYSADIESKLAKKCDSVNFSIGKSFDESVKRPVLIVEKEDHEQEPGIPQLLKINVSGVPDVKFIFYEKNDKQEWFVRTVGCDYARILLIPGVDTERTVSNNIWDTYNKLGIEAAREAYRRDFRSVMEGISPAHTAVLIDRMTFSGSISSISRYTLKKEDSSPLGKASFEESLENFIQASISGSTDSTTGNSASIVCGKKTRSGTGFMALRMDLNALRQK